MADLAYLRSRLEVVDGEVKEAKTALKITQRELRERPHDAVLLAERDLLANDLQHLYARQKKLEDRLAASPSAATASAPGLGSADGAGTASAANQGAVPLLGTGGPAADAPAPGLKDHFVGLGVAFVHVMCVGVVLALLAQWVINNNAVNVLVSTYASMIMNIYSVVHLMVPPLKQAWFQPSSTLSAYAKAFENLRKSLQNWRSESTSLLAAPIIFVLVGGGLAIMYWVSLKR